MKRKTPSKNLNSICNDSARKRQKTYSRGANKFSVHFDGTGIRNAVLRTIKQEDTKFVVGCVAWFSNKKILSELAKKDGVCVVVTRDKLTKSKSNQLAYRRLKPCFSNAGSIRVVGAGRGKFKSLMHHKFLIGLSATRQPLWVNMQSCDLQNTFFARLYCKRTISVQLSKRVFYFEELPPMI